MFQPKQKRRTINWNTILILGLIFTFGFLAGLVFGLSVYIEVLSEYRPIKSWLV